MKIPNSDSGEGLRRQAWPWSLVGIQICLEIDERLRKYFIFIVWLCSYRVDKSEIVRG